MFAEIIKFDKQLWSKVKTNLKLFYKSFVSPALLEFKTITYSGNSDTVFLEENEIEDEEEGEWSCIECDFCALMLSLQM